MKNKYNRGQKTPLKSKNKKINQMIEEEIRDKLAYLKNHEHSKYYKCLVRAIDEIKYKEHLKISKFV